MDTKIPTFDGRYADIPPHTQHMLKMWVTKGQWGGHFMGALVCGDMHAALSRADDENRRAFTLIVDWLHNRAPPACFRQMSLLDRDAIAEELRAWKGTNPDRVILDEDDGEAP